MKIKDTPNKNDIIFPDDTEQSFPDEQANMHFKEDVRNSRYNQHVSNAAFIIEVGATGNTLEECVGSMKYLANVLNEIMQ